MKEVAEMSPPGGGNTVGQRNPGIYTSYCTPPPESIHKGYTHVYMLSSRSTDCKGIIFDFRNSIE
jgi:hypothetical protein